MSDSEMGSDEEAPVDCVVRRGRGSGRAATQETAGHRHVKRGEPSPRSAGAGESVGCAPLTRWPASQIIVHPLLSPNIFHVRGASSVRA